MMKNKTTDTIGTYGKDFKESDYYKVMKKRGNDGLFLVVGITFIIFGLISLIYHYFFNLNLVFGSVTIYTQPTGILLFIIGILSALLHWLIK